MLDRIFFFSLLLNMTGIFRFLAPLINITIGQISISLLFFNLIYLFLKSNYTRYILKYKSMLPWIIILLIWPLATTVYSPFFSLREIGLQVYYFSIFLGTIVWVNRKGINSVYHLFALSLVVTIFGMALSKLDPALFEKAAILADAKVPGESIGARPTGFYLQPNSLAIALNLMFIGWFGLWKKKTPRREVLAITLFLALELATGSRAGIIVGVGIIGVYLLHNWKKTLVSGRLIYWLCIFPALLFFLSIGTQLYLNNIIQNTTSRHLDLLNRVESIIYLRFTTEDSITNDTSLQYRIMAQKIFLNYISRKPFHGYGLGSVRYYQDTGRIWLSAHSQFLTVAFEYGLFYPFTLFFMVLYLIKNKFRKKIECILMSNIFLQFIFAFLLLFSYSSILELRLFYVLLGVIVAILWFPYRFFIFKKQTE